MLVWFSISCLAFISIIRLPLYFGAVITFVVLALVVARSLILNGFLSGNTFLVILMLLFHFGIVIPVLVFDAPEPEVQHHWLNTIELKDAIALSLLGIVMIHCGSEIGSINTSNSAWKIPTTLYMFDTRIVNIWGTLMLSFFGLYYFIGIKQNLLFQDRAVYLELMNSGQSRWFGTFGDLGILSGFVLLAFASKRWSIVSCIFIILSLLPLFLVGKRGEFIVTIAALIIILHKKGFKIRLSAAFAGIALVLFSIPVLRNIRGGVQAFSDILLLDPFYEMGIQIRTVSYTLQAFSEGATEFWLGQSYFDAFMRTIPNIFGLRSIVGGSAADSPSSWLTETFNPGGAGLGNSLIAEGYLNFGIIGVIAVPFLIGYFLKRFDERAVLSPKTLAIYGILMKSLFWMVRNDSFVVIKPFCWMLCMLYVVPLIVPSLRYTKRKCQTSQRFV